MESMKSTKNLESMKTDQKKSENFVAFLWVTNGLLLAAMLVARAVFPEMLWLTIVVGAALLTAMGLLIRENQAALRSRGAAYGLNSFVTVLLIFGIVGVVNFLGSRYPLKVDWTKGKLHTLSDQTVKVVKGLQKPVKAALFVKMQEREKFRPLLDNYKGLNPKFEVEYIDPDRQPTRAKEAGVRKYGTLQLLVGTHDSKIEEPTEEKLTNALIKLLKDKTPTLCAMTGHGEKSFTANDAEGYDGARRALGNQSYEVKELNLVQETKIPESCDAILLMGPTKSLFEAEIKSIKNYLDQGGRALVALDINVKGEEYAPELFPVLQNWNIKPTWAVIVDPLSKMLGVDAAVPIVATYSKDHVITRDFQANSFFPFARPLEINLTAQSPLKAQWIGQTTPKSWAVTDPKQLTSGEVKLLEGRDRMGPLNIAAAVEGKIKDSKASRNTRLVVFGSSLFVNNTYSRYGGNLDLFLNAASWLMEDESLISIRAKEEGASKVELSQKAGTWIFLITVIFMPLFITAAGIWIWARRRRL